MTITIVIINPSQKMRLECGWRHAQGDGPIIWKSLKKTVEFLLWCGQVGVKPWCEKLGPDHDVEKLRLDYEMCWALGCCKDSMIRKTFKNCVSFLVSENRSQKLINGYYLNNGFHLCFVFLCSCICICTVVIDYDYGKKKQKNNFCIKHIRVKYKEWEV